jgi:hypothetical protein
MHIIFTVLKFFAAFDVVCLLVFLSFVKWSSAPDPYEIHEDNHNA